MRKDKTMNKQTQSYLGAVLGLALIMLPILLFLMSDFKFPTISIAGVDHGSGEPFTAELSLIEPAGGR